MEKTKKVLKYVGAGAVGALVGVGALGVAIDNHYSDPVEALKENVASLNQDVSSLNNELLVKDNLIKELQNQEPVVETLEVTTVNPVDAELLDSFDFLAEFPELSEVVLNDLDDDEGELIPERIGLFKEVHAKFVEYIKDELADELDKEEFYNVTFDEDDVEKIKVYDDYEDVVSFEDRDWDDEEFDIALKVKVEHDDEDYKFVVSARYEDGEFDNFEISEE